MCCSSGDTRSFCSHRTRYWQQICSRLIWKKPPFGPAAICPIKLFRELCVFRPIPYNGYETVVLPKITFQNVTRVMYFSPKLDILEHSFLCWSLMSVSAHWNQIILKNNPLKLLWNKSQLQHKQERNKQNLGCLTEAREIRLYKPKLSMTHINKLLHPFKLTRLKWSNVIWQNPQPATAGFRVEDNITRHHSRVMFAHSRNGAWRDDRAQTQAECSKRRSIHILVAPVRSDGGRFPCHTVSICLDNCELCFFSEHTVLFLCITVMKLDVTAITFR